MRDTRLIRQLKIAYRQAKEEEKRGELIDLDDLAAEFGFHESDFPEKPKPEGYDGLVKQAAEERTKALKARRVRLIRHRG